MRISLAPRHLRSGRPCGVAACAPAIADSGNDRVLLCEAAP
jgi:hypothetical protein